MLTFVFENLRVFPEWFQNLLLIAWGSLLLIVPLFTVFKIFQRPAMLSLFRATPGAVKQVGSFLQYQIDDPIKFPKVLRALEYAMVILSYILAGWTFLWFIFLIIAWAWVCTTATKPISLFAHAGILGFSFLTAYFAAVLKTQGSRGLLKLRGLIG